MKTVLIHLDIDAVHVAAGNVRAHGADVNAAAGDPLACHVCILVGKAQARAV